MSTEALRLKEEIERKATIVANEIERVIEAHDGAVLTEVLHKVGLPTNGRVWDEARAILKVRHGMDFQETPSKLLIHPSAFATAA